MAAAYYPVLIGVCVCVCVCGALYSLILWNDQQMRQCAVSLFLCKSTLHVSGGTHAHHQEYRSNCINSHWYNYWYQATLGGSTRDDLSLTNNCTNDCRYG